MYEVIYFSRGGNTRKLAVAIANELGVKAKHIRGVKTLPPQGEIFLGSGLYLMKPSKVVRDFIQDNDFAGRRVALFGTSASGLGIENLGMAGLLKRKGAIISGKFHCKGKFLLLRQGHPSARDLENARQFARSLTGVGTDAAQAVEKAAPAPA
jgi:flavodoxin